MKKVLGLLVCLLVTVQASSVCAHEIDEKLQSVDMLSDSLAYFSEQFYKQMVVRSDSNFAFSPLSLHSAISLLAVGSTKGSPTFMELSILLTKGRYLLKDLCTYRILYNEYKNKLAYGNHIWLAKGKQLNKNFTEAIDATNVKVENIDFGGDSAVDCINSWVNETTKGKISEIVSQLDSNSECVIVNALYFKEKWKVPFTGLDQPDEFIISETDRVNITMMYKQGYDMQYGTFKLENTSDHSHEVVRIPYQNSNFEMLIVLPHQDVGLHQLENSLGMHKTSMLDVLKDEVKYKKTEVYLRMPRFDLTTDVKATDILKALGLDRVFTKNSELGELTTSKNLRVSNVFHKAAITVALDGTEAAAATFIDIVPFSSAEPKRVFVNRPFLFILRDSKYKVPLMMGRIVDPSEAGV
jgi:serpin B